MSLTLPLLRINIKDQLICCSASFVVKCLSSGNDVVQFISRSVLQKNAFSMWQECTVLFFYSVPLCDISSVTKQLAWSVHYRHSILPEISKINLIKELLHVKYRMLSVSLLDCTDVDFMVGWLCTK